MWVTIFIIIYIVIGISIVFRILLYGVKPTKSLSWLLAIFTIPVGGMLLYLLLGRNRRKNKLVRLKKEVFSSKRKPPTTLRIIQDEEYKKLGHLVFKNSLFPPTLNNNLKLLKDGKTTFEAIFEALSKAKFQIHLQYYIFEEGELADQLLVLFKQKINEGVKIRMIYDGIGSFSLSKAYLKKLSKLGVEVFPFLPFKFGRFLSSLNYRNHRKIIVIDGNIAFTGGINISDKYLKGDSVLGNWHDMHLKIEGAAASHLDDVFCQDWYIVSTKKIEPILISNRSNNKNKTLVQIVSGGPDDDFPSLEQAYFTIINSAKDYLYITNPYIIPGQAIKQALQTAALSGVDVRLLISEKTDSILVGWCVRSYFESLLKSGIKIYLFPDGFLHSKVIVSDNKISTIGTANLYERSFQQNYEVNAIIYDERFAELLKTDFLKDIHISRMLSYQEYLQRPWEAKLKEGFGKIFSPIL